MSPKRIPVPVEIGSVVEPQFRLVWPDGHVSVYPWDFLRAHCPCAACVNEWTGERQISQDQVPRTIRATFVERVGAYALRFTWSDGHNTGIYTYESLRRMCQCPECTHR